jgi:hypothetical protein
MDRQLILIHLRDFVIHEIALSRFVKSRERGNYRIGYVLAFERGSGENAIHLFAMPVIEKLVWHQLPSLLPTMHSASITS